MIKSWLRFFRIVNLPTVPGDVLVGAASVAAAMASVTPVDGVLWLSFAPRRIVAACGAAVAIYLFGLADNDIVGARTDSGRPIPSGEITLGAARFTRALTLAIALGCSILGSLPFAWGVAATLLLIAVVVYNRTKWPLAMGACRGLNVVCGAFSVFGALRADHPTPDRFDDLPILACLVLPPIIWTAYIALVTRLSIGEETDPVKKSIVGALIGALVYLQLFALVAFAIIAPVTNRLLIAGAVLLVCLRIFRRAFPKVSAS